MRLYFIVTHKKLCRYYFKTSFYANNASVNNELNFKQFSAIDSTCVIDTRVFRLRMSKYRKKYLKK